MAGEAVRGTVGGAGRARTPAGRAVRGGGVLAVAVLSVAATVLPATAGANAAAGAATVPGITQRVSYGQGGSPLDAPARGGGVSADGRLVVFTSAAGNLVPGDTNGVEDGFVRDTWTGRIQRVTVGDGGRQLVTGGLGTVSLSADGRYVAFDSDEPGLVDDDTDALSDVFVFDRVTSRTVRVTPGGGGHDPVLSADGRYVAFSSTRKLDLPGGQEGTMNVFVLDRRTGVARLASVTDKGSVPVHRSWAATISADGQRVAFYSRTTDLPNDDPWQETEEPGEITQAPERPSGDPDAGGGTSAMKPTPYYPIWVFDQRTGHVRGGSAGPEYLERASSGGITPDGRYVAFTGWEIDERPGTPTGGLPRHRYIAYVHDLQTGKTTRVSLAADGKDSNGHDQNIATSGDSRWVYFASTSDNLVAGDTDGTYDLFRHNLLTGRTEMLFDLGDADPDGLAMVDGADRLGFSVLVTGPDGAFGYPADTNGHPDVFIRRVLPW